jgi:hypothetical protein
MNPDRDMLDAVDIRKVAETLGLKVRKNGNATYAPCPFCEGRDEPNPHHFQLGGEKKHLAYCHKCQQGVDAVGLVKLVRGSGAKDAFKWLRAQGLIRNWRPRTTGRKHASIVATYDYETARGEPLFQVVRLEPKDFRQRRPDGNGGWVWNLNGLEPVLYRLPELLEADPGHVVFIVEGEKDADALAALSLVATTSPMGAGRWL